MQINNSNEQVMGPASETHSEDPATKDVVTSHEDINFTH